MKLALRQENVELSSTDILGISFGIQEVDKGLIIDILRSKIYKDPIAAICRELMSNCRDANRENGRANDPIRVIIYDEENSLIDIGLGLSISFEDDGPGISPDRMSEVFVNYGSSTKRDSNSQTGCFGLGAKTPFSYTDNYAIITRVDGVKYFYIAAIEESRTGKVYLFKEEETKEKNGTSIVVPIKNSDRYSFEKKVHEVSGFWSVKPQYMNFKNNLLHGDIKEYKGVIVRDGYSSGLTLLIDEIPYHTDLSILDLKVNGHIVLSFKTGQLTLSATRENVQYDDKTKRLICDGYKKAIVILEKRAQDLIDKCETYLKAFCLLPEMRMNDPFVKALSSIAIFYRGQKIVSSLSTNEVYIGTYGRYDKTLGNKDMYKNPVYFVDRRIDKRRNEAVLDKGVSCFYLITLLENLKNFSSMSFKNKRLYSVHMRRAVNHLKWLESIGLKWKMYSEVKPLRVNYEKDRNYISCYDVKKGEAEVKFSTSSIRVKDFEGIKDKYLYCVYALANIRSKEIHELKKWAYLIEEAGRRNGKDVFKWQKVIFVSKTNEKFFKNMNVTLLSDAISKLHCDYIQELSNKAYLKSLNIDKSFLSALSLLKGMEKIKKISDLIKGSYNISTSFLPVDFHKIYPSNIDISIVEKVRKKYPLLDFIVGEALIHKKDVEEYIDLINNKEILCQKSNG